jgi:hypothetical protein
MFALLAILVNAAIAVVSAQEPVMSRRYPRNAGPPDPCRAASFPVPGTNLAVTSTQGCVASGTYPSAPETDARLRG